MIAQLVHDFLNELKLIIGKRICACIVFGALVANQVGGSVLKAIQVVKDRRALLILSQQQIVRILIFRQNATTNDLIGTRTAQ